MKTKVSILLLCCGLLTAPWAYGQVFAPSEIVLEGPGISVFLFHVGDLNGDGIQDLEVNPFPPAQNFPTHQLYTFSADATLTEFHSIESLLSIHRLLMMDVDGDDRAEFLVDNAVYVIGEVEDSYYPYNPVTPRSLVFAGDVNQDNLADVILERNDSLILGINDGTGAFIETLLDDNYDWQFVDPDPLIADFTGDGLLDLVVHPAIAFNPLPLNLHIQQEDGTFTAHSLGLTKYDMDEPSKLFAFDYTQNGRAEVMWKNDNGGISVMTIAGDTIGSLTNSFTAVGSATILEIADLNLDDYPDILCVNTSGDFGYYSVNQDGSVGAFELITDLPLSGYRDGYVLFDFEGDGDLDLLTQHQSGINYDLHFRENLTIDTPSSVASITEGVSIKVFPNPTDDRVRISVQSPAREPLFWELHGLDGRLLQRQALNGLAQEVKLPASLAGGTYVYRLVDQAGVVVSTDRLVIKK